MLVSFFILLGLLCVLLWALAVCAQEVVDTRKVSDEQGEMLREMMTSLTRTQGRAARSIAMRSQSYRHILKDVPALEPEQRS